MARAKGPDALMIPEKSLPGREPLLPDKGDVSVGPFRQVLAGQSKN